MPRKHNKNTYRNGATSQQHVVTTTAGSTAGSYTCTVTVSGTTSSDSAGFLVTATGLFFDMVQKSISYVSINQS